jgi:hypothetical protein
MSITVQWHRIVGKCQSLWLLFHLPYHLDHSSWSINEGLTPQNPGLDAIISS